MKPFPCPELSFRYKEHTFSSLPEEFHPKLGGQSRVGVQGASDEGVAPHGDSEPKYSEEGIPAEGNPGGKRWRQSQAQCCGGLKKRQPGMESEPEQGEGRDRDKRKSSCQTHTVAQCGLERGRHRRRERSYK